MAEDILEFSNNIIQKPNAEESASLMVEAQSKAETYSFGRVRFPPKGPNGTCRAPSPMSCPHGKASQIGNDYFEAVEGRGTKAAEFVA